MNPDTETWRTWWSHLPSSEQDAMRKAVDSGSHWPAEVKPPFPLPVAYFVSVPGSESTYIPESLLAIIDGDDEVEISDGPPHRAVDAPGYLPLLIWHAADPAPGSPPAAWVLRYRADGHEGPGDDVFQFYGEREDVVRAQELARLHLREAAPVGRS